MTNKSLALLIQFARVFHVSRCFPAIRRLPIAVFLLSQYITFYGKSVALTPRNQQRDNIMKTAPFLGTLSTVERALVGAIAITLSLASTTVIAVAFQGAAIADSHTLIALLAKAFA